MSRFKNITITLLIDWILYIYMQQSEPRDMLLVITIMTIVMPCFWKELEKIIGTVVLRKKNFKRYKNWFLTRLNEKRLKGYDDNRLKSMALSIITHQKKYAFTGKQIEELLELTKDDYVTNCIQCGKAIARKDVLVTVGGEICEECLEVS